MNEIKLLIIVFIQLFIQCLTNQKNMKTNATVLSVLMAIGIFAFANQSLQAKPAVGSTSAVQSDKDKVKIKKEELPEAARKTLEGDAFKGWNVSNAYKLTNGEYEVELVKGTNNQTVKFDKDGKAK